MNIRTELMPFPLHTINIDNGTSTLGIDLTIPARIRAGKGVTFSAPFMATGLLSTDLTKSKERTIEGLLGVGRDNVDKLTSIFYNNHDLPNWLRITAVVAIDSPGNSCEIRPVTSQHRVDLSLAIAKAKEEKSPNLGLLVSKLRQMRVQDETQLHPFVVPIYPSRVEGEKVVDRRIFAVGVGWDASAGKWKGKTSFEVISDIKGKCNNFLVHVEYQVDSNGNPTTTVVLEPRWK